MNHLAMRRGSNGAHPGPIRLRWTAPQPRDAIPGSSPVAYAIAATLHPPTPWWDAVFAMAGLEAANVDGSSSLPTTDHGMHAPVGGGRPDSDLLELEPAEQLTALTRRHADAVYRVARSVLRDPDLAEDVAQDALLKAWQALPSYRGDAPLKNWLLRIAHNTAISALRRRREVHVDPADFAAHASSLHSTSPSSVEAQVEDRASFDAFAAALDELDDLSRSVVVLREVEGLAYDEIATVLEVPLPTVKTRLLRARRLLSNALQGWRP